MQTACVRNNIDKGRFSDLIITEDILDETN